MVYHAYFVASFPGFRLSHSRKKSEAWEQGYIFCCASVISTQLDVSSYMAYIYASQHNRLEQLALNEHKKLILPSHM